MQLGRLSALILLGTAIAIGCSGKSTSDGSGGSAGTGAGAGTGGNPGTGASAGTGANAGTGASSGTGGASPKDCQLPKEPGNCLAAIPRWWFNAQTGKCEQFTYGGCGGNANNFESMEQCVGSCAAASINDPCTAVTCDPGMSCVYFSETPACAPPCDPAAGCPVGTICGCGSSCPGCDDCMMVCKPQS